MILRVGASLGAVLFAALLPPAGVAKGPIEATLEGPGLDAPIVFKGWSEDGTSTKGPYAGSNEDRASAKGPFPLGPLVDTASFFPAALGSYDAAPVERPKGDLGPRYTVTYDLGGSEGAESLVVQDVYPYANPNAVTYMAPGQPFYGSMETVGGWFLAPSAPARPLKDVFVEAGLPRSPPTGSDGSSFPWTVAGAVVTTGALLAFGAVAVLVGRRRPRPATT